MRIHRGYALAAIAWLVVVVVGAVLVWAVISRAGQDVIGQSTPPIEQAAPFTSPPQHNSGNKPRSHKSKPKPNSKPSRPGSGSPGASPSAGPSGPGPGSGPATSDPSPSAPATSGSGPRPGPGPGPGPSSSPNNPPPASSPPPQPPAEEQGVRRSWQGSAGVVTVECRGARIELKGAQPNSGWSIEIDDRGPDEVRVDFDSNDGDRRTRVESVCVGGTPRFEVDHEDD